MREKSAEGYNDYVHNQVRLYWKHSVMDKRKNSAVNKNERMFKKLIIELDLTEEERYRIENRHDGIRTQNK